MGRSPGVGISLSPGSLRESRRKALVVKLHRYGDSPLEALGKRPRPLGLLPLLAAHRQRKPNKDPLGALILDQPGERGEPALRVRPLHHAQRSRERARRIRHGHAAAGGAVVEREDAHQASAFSISARAVASASSSFSGSLPPACASVSRPPPPPPTTGAAARTSLAALTPRSTTDGATFATRCTRSSPAVAKNTTASPSFCRAVSEMSRSALGSRSSRARINTRAPLTSSAFWSRE